MVDRGGGLMKGEHWGYPVQWWYRATERILIKQKIALWPFDTVWFIPGVPLHVPCLPLYFKPKSRQTPFLVVCN